MKKIFCTLFLSLSIPLIGCSNDSTDVSNQTVLLHPDIITEEVNEPVEVEEVITPEVPTTEEVYVDNGFTLKGTYDSSEIAVDSVIIQQSDSTSNYNEDSTSNKMDVNEIQSADDIYNYMESIDGQVVTFGEIDIFANKAESIFNN